MVIDLKKVDASAEFLHDVELLVTSKNIGYLEAVQEWCVARNLEPEYAGALVKKNRRLKAMIKEEAVKLNCLKRDD